MIDGSERPNRQLGFQSSHVVDQRHLRGCPRNSGQGKFSTFTDFSNNFSESRPLYPMNKYHIYLDQIFYFYFLRGGFYCNLKTTQFAFEDSII